MRFNSVSEPTNSKLFLKLKDKESITGIFIGDPVEYHVLWENNKSKVVPEGTAGSSFRFKICFVVKEGAVYVPKIFENGITVYRQLSDMHSEYNLEETVVKITRNGLGTDTTYSILPLLKQTISPETAKHLKTLKLPELSIGQKQESNEFVEDSY